MDKLQNIELMIYGTQINISTDEPAEMMKLAEELNHQLLSLASNYPGVKQNVILTLACLKALGDSKKLNKENLKLSEERDKVNKTLQGIHL